MAGMIMAQKKFNSGASRFLYNRYIAEIEL
jgi:hypothetical protein